MCTADEADDPPGEPDPSMQCEESDSDTESDASFTADADDRLESRWEVSSVGSAASTESNDLPASPAADAPRRSSRPRAATGAASFRFDPTANASRPQLGSPSQYQAYSLRPSKGRNCGSTKRHKSRAKEKRLFAAQDVPPPANHDPSFSKAMADPVYGDFWRKAMDEEWNNLFESGAFRWVKRSECDKRIRPLPCHVLAKYKPLSKRYKMRVVINGSLQKEGSYGNTYAPTIAATLVSTHPTCSKPSKLNHPNIILYSQLTQPTKPFHVWTCIFLLSGFGPFFLWVSLGIAKEKAYSVTSRDALDAPNEQVANHLMNF